MDSFYLIIAIYRYATHLGSSVVRGDEDKSVEHSYLRQISW